MRGSVTLNPQSSPPGCVLCMKVPLAVPHSTAVYALPAASCIAPRAAPSMRALAITRPPSSTTQIASTSERLSPSARTAASSSSAWSSDGCRCSTSPSMRTILRPGLGLLLGVLHFGELLDHLRVEGRDVVRLAAGDEPLVDHDLLV